MGIALLLALLACVGVADAAAAERVVDVPSRPGVIQRFVLLTPAKPRAAIVLFAGGHGGLQIKDDGSYGWGKGNFLVRSREHFADRDLAVAVIDAPSDRQSAPFLGGFRQTPKHVEDVRAVVAWLREHLKAPVWLAGTSRGTQSIGYLATQLGGRQGPDGIVLTATILRDDRGRAVPEMELGRIEIPVLVVHHELDGCVASSYADIPRLMEKLAGTPRKELFTIRGGENRGDPCEAFAYHGFNGLERQVVRQIADWVLAGP
jgi:hypothetical protein